MNWFNAGFHPGKPGLTSDMTWWNLMTSPLIYVSVMLAATEKATNGVSGMEEIYA